MQSKKGSIVRVRVRVRVRVGVRGQLDVIPRAVQQGV